MSRFQYLFLIFLLLTGQLQAEPHSPRRPSRRPAAGVAQPASLKRNLTILGLLRKRTHCPPKAEAPIGVYSGFCLTVNQDGKWHYIKAQADLRSTGAFEEVDDEGEPQITDTVNYRIDTREAIYTDMPMTYQGDANHCWGFEHNLSFPYGSMNRTLNVVAGKTPKGRPFLISDWEEKTQINRLESPSSPKPGKYSFRRSCVLYLRNH